MQARRRAQGGDGRRSEDREGSGRAWEAAIKTGVRYIGWYRQRRRLHRALATSDSDFRLDFENRGFDSGSPGRTLCRLAASCVQPGGKRAGADARVGLGAVLVRSPARQMAWHGAAEWQCTVRVRRPCESGVPGDFRAGTGGASLTLGVSQARGAATGAAVTAAEGAGQVLTGGSPSFGRGACIISLQGGALLRGRNSCMSRPVQGRVRAVDADGGRWTVDGAGRGTKCTYKAARTCLLWGQRCLRNGQQFAASRVSNQRRAS